MRQLKITKSITNRESQSLEKYLQEIGKVDLLTPEEEVDLAKRIKQGDQIALEKLTKANLRFVVSVAKQYQNQGLSLSDLINEGNLGLIKAAQRFDETRGFKFISYAVWWIRGYIQEYLMKQYSLVKIGTTQNQKKLFYQLQKQRDELDSMGRTPDIQLLSTRLGIPADEVEVMAQRMSGRDVSLDRPVGDDSSSSYLDFQKSEGALPDDEISKREEMSHLTETIEELMPSLSAREKIILEERILNDEPLTLQEIGEKYGITREAVRQMEARLLKKIKERYQKA